MQLKQPKRKALADARKKSRIGGAREEHLFLTPVEVREVIQTHQNPGETFTAAAERFAVEHQMSRRVVFNYLKHGVAVDISASAATFIKLSGG